MPSRYSKNAPPAVETKLNLSFIFSELITATVSPPPTTENILFPLFAIYFATGSFELAKEISAQTKSGNIFSVIGGGDTVSVINKLKLFNDFNFVSTAGGAFLEYLEGKELPGIKALKND